MARSRSEDKRNSILAAAVQQFAERGIWSTPTAAISLAAGVAQGTLFTYFATKEALVMAVYAHLNHEIGNALLSAYPKAADARIRLRHLWDRYILWGTTHPQRFHVLTQLQASAQLPAEMIALGAAALREIERVAKDGVRKKRIRNFSLPYLAALMATQAETTINFMTQNPRSRFDYRAAGFDLFWSGIALQ